MAGQPVTYDNWFAAFMRKFLGYPKCDDCQGIRGGCQECDYTGYRSMT